MPELVCLALFVALTPLYLKVNFYQNDDWNRNTSVIRFMHGDFSLLPVTATTFYSQGIPGMIFAFVFGAASLPLLTLFVSVLNMYILIRILKDHFQMGNLLSLLLGALFFFTPLHMYSSVGFMTENYLVLYMLVSVYFFLRFERTQASRDLVLFDLFSLLAFFSKQNGIILLVASIGVFVVRKKWKYALAQTGLLAFLMAVFYFVFPITPEMQNKTLIFTNFGSWKYAYSLIYGILLVSVSFVLPMVLSFVFSSYLKLATSKKYIVLGATILVGLALFVLLNKNFYPGEISWEEYPYFENTFERTGFLPRTVLGTKYQFKFNYDLYRYWDTVSKLVLALSLPLLFVYLKKLINLFSVSIVGYLILMVLTETFFDRYNLPLLPLLMLFIVYVSDIQENKISKVFNYISLIGFVFVTAFLSLQLTVDFILTQNYIWSKSSQLVSKGITGSQIRATGAWGKVYGTSADYTYIFSYDSPSKNPELRASYELKDIYKPSVKPNIFIDPAVYLYEKKLKQ